MAAAEGLLSSFARRWTPSVWASSSESEPAVILALLRIAVGVIILISPEPEIARLVAARPSALWIHPEGLGWLGSIVPLGPRSIAVAIRLLQVAALLSLFTFGIATRSFLVLLSLTTLYVFGAAQLTGTVTHDMHLFWFAAFLAVTPGAGEALSLDAWVRRRSVTRTRASASTSASTKAIAGWGVLVARLWLGLIYFFPGAQKLAHGFGGADLRGQMYFKWFEAGSAPWPRVDRIPWLLDVAAIGVVLFELAMPVLVLFRRTRIIAIALGLFFHLAAGHFLDVLFPSLIACYVVLIPSSWIERLKKSTTRTAGPAILSRRRRWVMTIPMTIVGAVFTLGIVIQGARGQTQSYPFACYPTFADRVPDEISDLAIDVVFVGEDHGASAAAAAHEFRLPLRRRQDEWGMVWRLAGLYGDRVDPVRLRGFARRVVPPGVLATPNIDLRWMIETYDLNPDRYGSRPRTRRLLYEERWSE